MQIQRKPRPKFALWRFERGLTVRETARRLSEIAGHRICSHEKVRTICLPFDDPARTEPDAPLAGAIYILTNGECPPLSFIPPEGLAA
jgi:hypothetical protein